MIESAVWSRTWLSDLLQPWLAVPEIYDVELSGITIDSRQVKPGDVFCACIGAVTTGHQYIEAAVQGGAVVVLAEGMGVKPGLQRRRVQDREIVWVDMPDLRAHLSVLGDRFYGAPSAQMQVIAVTGTNGKTSCTGFLNQAMAAMARKCGVIGTLGFGFGEQLSTTGMTTPDALTVQYALATLQRQGAEAVALEVSSHALSQDRVRAVAIDLAVLTNLSREHLDYHGDMAQYRAAKTRLFAQVADSGAAVLNLNDAFGRHLAERYLPKMPVIGYGIDDEKANLVQLMPGCAKVIARRLVLQDSGFSCQVTTPWGQGRLQGALLGRFNVSNVLAVLACLGHMGVPLKAALKAVQQLVAPPGRMTRFGGGLQPLVVVDYAHTPDALAEVLQALRPHCKRRLWCVFGCGGERDVGKRRLMGEVAERYSDEIVLTSDNPRSESPQAIMADIAEGLLCPWAVQMELHRPTAIADVLQSAGPGDIVLVAGKGHECVQEVGGEFLPYSDLEHVQRQLSLRAEAVVQKCS